jgi:hypothetical protein
MQRQLRSVVKAEGYWTSHYRIKSLETGLSRFNILSHIQYKLLTVNKLNAFTLTCSAKRMSAYSQIKKWNSYIRMSIKKSQGIEEILASLIIHTLPVQHK